MLFLHFFSHGNVGTDVAPYYRKGGPKVSWVHLTSAYLGRVTSTPPCDRVSLITHPRTRDLGLLNRDEDLPLEPVHKVVEVASRCRCSSVPFH